MGKKKNKSLYKWPAKYFMLDHLLLNHPKFIALKHSSVNLLIELCRLYDGFNNGNLSVAIDVMKLRGWSSGTLSDAKKELVESGLVYKTRQGGKGIGCCLLALAWVPLDEVKINESGFKTGHIAFDLKKT